MVYLDSFRKCQIPTLAKLTDRSKNDWGLWRGPREINCCSISHFKLEMKFSLAALCAVFGASAVQGFVPLIPSTAFLVTNSPTFSMPRSMSSLRLGASVQRPDVTKKDKRREYMAKDSYFK